MSKQPRRVREALARLRTQLVLPQDKNPNQLWCLVRQEPSDSGPGCFFVTHGRNFDKFDKRPGFEVIGHGFDRTALTAAAHSATLACGPAYQPKFSAHKATEAAPDAPDSDAPTWGSDDPYPKH